MRQRSQAAKTHEVIVLLCIRIVHKFVVGHPACPFALEERDAEGERRETDREQRRGGGGEVEEEGMFVVVNDCAAAISVTPWRFL